MFTRNKKKKRLKKPKKTRKKKKFGKLINKFKGELGFMYPWGYVDTDPYLFLGKKVISIFDVTFVYGDNRPDVIGWVNKFIPSTLIESGKVIFVQRQKGVDKDTQNDITSKTLASSIITMASSDDKDAQEDSKNSDRIQDMQMSASLAKNNIMIDSDLMLIVRADTPEDIERAVYELKMCWKNELVRGVMVTRRTGQQLKSLREMILEVHGDIYHNTDMSAVAAGRLFLPSVGFSDPRGVMIGTDRQSIIERNTSVVDFSEIRNAVIFMGGVQPYVSIGGYEGGAFMQNGGSAVAHVIADGNYLNGGRTHYIVLSQNSFHTTDSLYFDMSKETINPFEVFGKPETVQNDANDTFDKINTMLLRAAGAENNDYIKNHLKQELIDWYTYKANGNGIYAHDPEHDPIKAQRILATKDHENYPRPSDFLLNMNNMLSAADMDERKDVKLMYRTMSNLVDSYPIVFDKATTLPDVFRAKDRNIYYDLSKISENPTIISIIFLNVLAYVTHRALPGETIVIEGLDEINLPVESLEIYKRRMEHKGINLISVFERMNNPINPISYENFVGRLSQQDMVVLGGITEKDAKNFSKSWQQELPSIVAHQLEAANPGILYFYRKRDHIGAIVDTHLIL